MKRATAQAALNAKTIQPRGVSPCFSDAPPNPDSAICLSVAVAGQFFLYMLQTARNKASVIPRRLRKGLLLLCDRVRPFLKRKIRFHSGKKMSDPAGIAFSLSWFPPTILPSGRRYIVEGQFHLRPAASKAERPGATLPPNT